MRVVCLSQVPVVFNRRISSKLVTLTSLPRILPLHCQSFRNCRHLSFSACRYGAEEVSFDIMSGDQATKQYNVVFVLGGPGAGKGTQCERIQEKFGYVHLSAGELLREERQREGSEFGDVIETHIRNGTIVPVAITCALLRRAMEKSGRSNFLIDGFPRNQDNLDGWCDAMNSLASVQRVLFFNCSEQVCVDRCLKRGKTSGRSDDNEESLKKRIQTYSQSTMPIIDHYRRLGLVSELEAGKTPEEVFQDVENVFESLPK